ncbi:uncharacterized protein LOC134191919 [Corticium candelabrum]|uniref:uncharacterized protein LOC134191919 n=1 Tax=Corticium candelabrum TaxID=121492 RepID=UPI002E273868|nr:uncharacterized protein LOC134191919 [Corticium candelabrum]
MVSATVGTAVVGVIAAIFVVAAVLLALALCKLRGKCGFRQWKFSGRPQRRLTKGREGFHAFAVLPSVSTGPGALRGPYSVAYEEISMRDSWVQSGIYEDIEVGRQPTKTKEKDQSNVSLISVNRFDDDAYNVAASANVSNQHPPYAYTNPLFQADNHDSKQPENMRRTLEATNQGYLQPIEVVVHRGNETKTQAEMQDVESTTATDTAGAASSVAVGSEIQATEPQHDKNTSTAANEGVVYAHVNKDKKRPKSDTQTTEPIYARVDKTLKRKCRGEKVQSLPTPQEINEDDAIQNSNLVAVQNLLESNSEFEEPGYAKLNTLTSQ